MTTYSTQPNGGYRGRTLWATVDLYQNFTPIGDDAALERWLDEQPLDTRFFDSVEILISDGAYERRPNDRALIQVTTVKPGTVKKPRFHVGEDIR